MEFISFAIPFAALVFLTVKVAAIVSNMTSKEAKKLMNQFFNKGKIDLRGYDANILDVDAYDSFINECPDEEDFCEADIEDADFELKNL